MPLVVDVLIAVILLVALLPVFLLISIVLLLVQGLPVFFRQQRMGKNFRIFTIYKYRTMEVKQCFEKGSCEVGDSSRVTLAGRFLRKTKLDELPQLINVLKGDMALVGPRPEVERWVKAYPRDWAQVLQIRPGITDPASLIYRHEEELLARQDSPEEYYLETVLPHKLAVYKEYLKNKGLVYDLGVCFKTLFKLMGKS